MNGGHDQPNKQFYEEDLSIDEAIFLIEWGYDISNLHLRPKDDSKKRMEG